MPVGNYHKHSPIEETPIDTELARRVTDVAASLALPVETTLTLKY